MRFQSACLTIFSFFFNISRLPQSVSHLPHPMETLLVKECRTTNLIPYQLNKQKKIWMLWFQTILLLQKDLLLDLPLSAAVLALLSQVLQQPPPSFRRR